MRNPVLQYLLPLFVVMMALYAPDISAQQTSSSLPARPTLDRFLNPDGTLNLSSGFNGTLDASGWRLVSSGDEPPRFERVIGDEHWDDRFGPPGTNGSVHVLMIHRDDVYVGGKFTLAGTVMANNIARWNSVTKQWSAIADGLSGAVYALAVSGNEIYAGGIFMTSDANGYVARWHSGLESWDILGDSGITPIIDPVWGLPDGQPGAYVYGLAVLGSEVYIGGQFDKADGVTSPNLIKWNNRTGRFSPVRAIGTVRALLATGSQLYVGGTVASVAGVTVNNIAMFDTNTKVWSPLGIGVNGTVNALALGGNTLYVGGEFTSAGGSPAANIAKWDRTASSWSPLGGGVSRPVRTIAVTGSDVYVGGEIMQAGSSTANGIARWNGSSWSNVGSGVGDNAPPVVHALAARNDSLYIGGKYSTIGSYTAHNIAGWDTEDWFQLGRFGLKELNLNGTDDAVFAVAISGQDVYIGGDFTRAGDVDASYVARYNVTSNTWHPLGTGIGGPSPFVRAIAVSGSNVYVGGIFTQAGSVTTSGIALWNGTAWSAVGGGVGGPTPYVFALAVSGSDLYVGGAFTQAGTVAANRVARWNGSAWSALGSGLAHASGFSSVNTLAVSGSNVYAGGDFTLSGTTTVNRIARWTGSAWSALGSGMNAPVSALAFNGDTLYAGGEFTLAGGSPALYIARWNGSAWSGVGGGFNAPVRALAFSGSGLLAGGEFTASGTTSLGRIARWTGSSWVPLQVDAASNGVNGPVRAVAVTGSTLYVGGGFSIAGGLRANNIAEWDGRIWSSLGSDPTAGLQGPVLAIARQDTNVYVGGLFTSAGGMRASGVARWDGHRWLRMGRGINGPVRALAIVGNDLYAGGEFDTAGTVRAVGIAKWNGSDWSALGEGLGGPKPYAAALAASGTDLYIGGGFDRGGGVTSRRIIRYNTASGQWSAVGSGIGGGPFFTYVTAIAARGSDVYVGGVFPQAGSVLVNNIARWNGTAWSALGEGINNAVYAVAVDGTGDVYVGGSFSAVGDISTNNIARWNGTSWSALGEGLNRDVYALGFYDDELFAGGAFTGSGGVGVNHIGRWNGIEWITMGGGVGRDSIEGRALALVTYEDGVYVGGDFTIAGGRPSYYFGHWRRTPFLSVRQRKGPATSSMNLHSYPNPTGSTATISFVLSDAGHTTLTITTVRGEHLATLVDGFLPAGEQTLRWDATGIADGTYFYQLRAGDAVESGRIVVVR